jgi:WS/DGAT/MGAT family acyltransferase
MLLDLERDPAEEPAAPADDEDTPLERATPLGVLGRTLVHVSGRPWDMARGAVAMGASALRDPKKFVEMAGSIRDQVFIEGAALSPLMTERSLGRRFDLLTVQLDDAKAAAQALGGTVNDVFVAGIAGGLGLYHERMGTPAEELRLAMPISLRESSEGVSGNRFTPVRVVVPVAPKDPVERFAAVHERLHAARGEPALNLLEPLAGLVGLLPTSLVVPVTRSQSRTIDFIASNLRGAPIDLYLGGALIEHNHPMGPCTGCAVNVTTLSYRGNLDMGINSDTAAVTDPDTLVESLQESFDELVAVDKAAG